MQFSPLKPTGICNASLRNNDLLDRVENFVARQQQSEAIVPKAFPSRTAVRYGQFRSISDWRGPI